MKMKFLSISILVIIILTSCVTYVEEESTIPSFLFDSNGIYMGFDSIPENYTVEQAIEDGCYVMKGSFEYGGSNSWMSFIADSQAGNNSNIRIMFVFDEITFYYDLFYIDGYYRVFDSTSKGLTDNKSKYLLELCSRLPNAALDSYYVVLTDDEILSFKDVSTALLSSSTRVINSISSFKIVIMGIFKNP